MLNAINFIYIGTRLIYENIETVGRIELNRVMCFHIFFIGFIKI